MFEGFFELQTAQDLLAKLRHDFDRLKKSPMDSYAAFDFFVTAYHMLEWGYREPRRATNLREKGKLVSSSVQAVSQRRKTLPSRRWGGERNNTSMKALLMWASIHTLSM